MEHSQLLGEDAFLRFVKASGGQRRFIPCWPGWIASISHHPGYSRVIPDDDE